MPELVRPSPLPSKGTVNLICSQSTVLRDNAIDSQENFYGSNGSVVRFNNFNFLLPLLSAQFFCNFHKDSIMWQVF